MRATLTSGFLISALSLALVARLPVGAHYFWDLFPAFVLGGAGMALSFVPVTIGSLAGVQRADAGVASGLINTSRQIGGAIGIASITAIAAAATGPVASTAQLDHGYRVALVVLLGLLVAGATITVAFIRPARGPSLRPVEEPAELELERAA